MIKNKFIADYQINASKKIVFNYLSTASGLSEWFADDVTINEDKNYIFYFDNENHHARLVALRTNMHVKFEFYDPAVENEEDHSYIEFKLDENELTQTLYIKVIDYSDVYDDDESVAIWEGLISQLKEIIGG
jgi:uncharacterized protein YndB with AHSA1/START domain